MNLKLHKLDLILPQGTLEKKPSNKKAWNPWAANEKRILVAS